MASSAIIRTADDFSSQTWANGLEVSVANPIHTLDPRIMAQVKGSEVQRPLILEYGGVKVYERFTPEYPNVTLAHYAVGHAMRERKVQPNKIVDFGCGVGFIGNFAAMHLNPQEVVFTDLSTNALNQSAAAYAMNTQVDLNALPKTRHQFGMRMNAGKHILDFRLGDVRQTLSGETADVAAAAPMFVPGICEVFPQAYQLFAAVSKHIGAQLFVGHTNLARDKVHEAAQATGMKYQTVFEQTVPLRLEYSDATRGSIQVTNNRLPKELESFLASRGLEIRDEEENPYFHRIMVTELHASPRLQA